MDDVHFAMLLPKRRAVITITGLTDLDTGGYYFYMQPSEVAQNLHAVIPQQNSDPNCSAQDSAWGMC
jgi:hypothetical protein